MPLHTHHAHRRSSLNSNRSSTDDMKPDSAGGVEDDATIVEPDQGNVLSHIISQLRPGADLSRVTLPTFILEPRSMLERITNFMAHPETLLPMPQIDDPVKRFVAVVKFYLSGWHIKPPGVKKPLNPILGETFTCYWEYPDHTRGYYIAEQTSHHPPKSSYFFMAPDHGIRVDGTLKPRSKFLGNSAASMMEGISYLRFLNRGKSRGGEKYILTQPNMYARGILFGKMKYELGDHSYVRCPENNLTADIEFKTKGYFSGTYNAMGGVIKNEKTGEVLYELSGMWNGEMHIKNLVTGHKELLFNATNAKHTPPQTRRLEEQADRESQKLWRSTVLAVNARDHEKATDEKTKIEDRQREEAAKRAEEGIDWTPKLFRRVRAGPGESEEGEADLDWILNATIDGKDPKTMTEQILAITPILPGQKVDSAFDIPPHTPNATPNHNNNLQPEQNAAAPPSGDGNDLIDFGDSASNAKVVTANQNISSQHRARSVSLMDDDRHINAMNDKMGNMNLMGPMQASGNPSTGEHQPLERTDTETSEVDSFFDAEG
ncbi:hypothetical protein GJ744_007495 [Endocarpon pusillum]|uniref:Oxysterol-binding protein-like protein OBPalpha n=1 Tax=Endocarpon pusillum TaxID=364733 RepID=A0A8H7E626_9EURO|nr:hypothetical protein GJ744_007495 [Endocarpon pusillum]